MSGCGKKATKTSLSEAGRMTNTQLMEFIMDNAPADVATKMLDKRITSRSGLCELLDTFPKGRALKRESRGVPPSKAQAATRIQRAFRRASAAHVFNLRHATRQRAVPGSVAKQIFASGFMPGVAKKLKRITPAFEPRAFSSVPLNYRHMVRANAKKATARKNRQEAINLAQARAERQAFEELNWGSGSSSNRSSRSNKTLSSGSSSSAGSASNRFSGSGSNTGKGNRSGAAPTKGGNLRKRPENMDPRLGKKTRFSALKKRFRGFAEGRGKRFTNFSHELYFGSEDEKKRKKKLKNPRKASARNTNSNRALSYRGLNLPKTFYSSSSSNTGSPVKKSKAKRFINLAAHRYYGGGHKAVVHAPMSMMKYPNFKSGQTRRKTQSQQVLSKKAPITRKQREMYENLKKAFFKSRNKSRVAEIFGSSSSSSSESNTNKQLAELMEKVRRNYPANRRTIGMGFPVAHAPGGPRQPLTRERRIKKSTYRKLMVNMLSGMNVNKIKKLTVKSAKQALANKMGVNVNSVPSMGKTLSGYMNRIGVHQKAIKVRQISKRKPMATKFYPGPELTKLRQKTLWNSSSNSSPNRLSNVD